MSATITHSGGVITPAAVDGYQASRTSGTIVHPILGSSAVDVTLRPSSLRVGTLTLAFLSETGASAAVAALCMPQVLVLAFDSLTTAGMRFVIPEGQEVTLRLSDQTRSVWFVGVPFHEVQT